MEVTGLVLSLGEKTTPLAIDALNAQTYPCKEIKVIKNITPFHRAMNEGIQQIATPFFLQCDADMAPDPDCVEVLLSHMKENTGITIGYLQDKLWGKIQAIKLFRTSCAKEVGFDNHVSPDTNYIERMTNLGYEYVFVKRDQPRHGHDLDTLGTHDPDYTHLYTFQKFRIEGARMMKRGFYGEFLDNMERFIGSKHPMAKIAIIGLCRGMFDEGKNDALEPYKEDKDYKKLFNYINGNTKSAGIFAPVPNETQLAFQQDSD